MKKQDEKLTRIDPSSLGIPNSSMDPIETIKMEGNLYRGIAARDPKRKLSLRIIGIVIGLTLFTSSLVNFVLLTSSSYGLFTLISIAVGIIFFLAGAKMIWVNISF